MTSSGVRSSALFATGSGDTGSTFTLLPPSTHRYFQAGVTQHHTPGAKVVVNLRASSCAFLANTAFGLFDAETLHPMSEHSRHKGDLNRKINPRILNSLPGGARGTGIATVPPGWSVSSVWV